MCLPMRAHWRHLENTTELVLLSANESPQPKWQIDQFSHLRTAHGRVSSSMPCMSFPLIIAPLHWRIWDPSNTCFLGFTRDHNPNGISIGSAIFAQLTAEFPYTLQWATLYPKTAPSHWGIWISISYMICWAYPRLQPKQHLDGFSRFLQGSQEWQTDRPHYSVGNNRPYVRM